MENISDEEQAELSRIEYARFCEHFPENPNEEVNWIHRHPRLATPIKNQGNCGCCWAISAALAISFMMFLHSYPDLQRWDDFMVSCQDLLNRVIYYFPETMWWNLIDANACYPNYPEVAYAFCMKYGLPAELRCPFLGYREYIYNSDIGIGMDQHPRVRVSDFEMLGSANNPEELTDIRNSLLKQPLVGCIDCTPQLRSYGGEGIFEPLPCTALEDPHAILIVAMNTKEDYFIIRNSWGPQWAKGGYFKIRCRYVYRVSCPKAPFLVDNGYGPPQVL